MKFKYLILLILSLISLQSSLFGQHTKHKMYIYWGWNRAFYTNSDIRFKGNNYDFTISKVIAKDRQTPFAFDPYFHPLKNSLNNL